MSYLKKTQLEREAFKMQILKDRKVSADKLWEQAYKKALDGNIDREQLYNAALLSSKADKALMEATRK